MRSQISVFSCSCIHVQAGGVVSEEKTEYAHCIQVHAVVATVHINTLTVHHLYSTFVAQKTIPAIDRCEKDFFFNRYFLKIKCSLTKTVVFSTAGL